MLLIRLHSDNYNGELVTPEAYEEIALTMSSGDHGVHTYELIVLPETNERVITLEELTND